MQITSEYGGNPFSDSPTTADDFLGTTPSTIRVGGPARLGSSATFGEWKPGAFTHCPEFTIQYVPEIAPGSTLNCAPATVLQ